MSCERFEERLHDLLDRRLSGEEEAELRVHLASCGRCAQTLRDLEELLVATRSMPEEAPPAGFADAIMRSVAADDARARRGRFRLISLGALGSIAAGFLLFVLFQPSIDSLKSSPAPASEVSLAKASDKEKEAVNGPNRFSYQSQSTVDKKAFEKERRESGEKLAAGLEAAKDDKPATLDFVAGSAAEAEEKQEERSDADAARRGKQAAPKDVPAPSKESFFYAFVDKPQVESQLRDSLKVLEKTATEKKKSEVAAEGKTQEKVQESTQKNESANGFAMGLLADTAKPANRTIRYRIPRSQLASLQEQWKKIPGLRMQEAPAPSAAANRIALGRTAGTGAQTKDAAPPPPKSAPAEAPKPAAPGVSKPEDLKKEHGGTYRGPGDSVAPGNTAVPGVEDWIEIVITILPEPPAEKPK